MALGRGGEGGFVENALELVNHALGRLDGLGLQFQALAAVISEKHATVSPGETGAPPAFGAVPLEIEYAPAAQAHAFKASAPPTPRKCGEQTERAGCRERKHFVDGRGDAVVGLGLDKRARAFAVIHGDAHVAKVVVSGEQIHADDGAAEELQGLQGAAGLAEARVDVRHVRERVRERTRREGDILAHRRRHRGGPRLGIDAAAADSVFNL